MSKHTLSRRNFIKLSGQVGILSSLSSLPFSTLAKSHEIKLTILHTNDWHSRIDPFPMNGGPYQGLGGAVARAALIKKIRQEEEYVLLLDAGDIFQGTPYFNFYGGELEYKLMSEMQYDCATLGNHDFDNGIDGIIRQLPNASFPFVNCNYDFGNTALKDKIQLYKIFHKGPLKIGVLGVGIELKGLVPDKLFENVIYNDPIVHTNRIASELKNKHQCDLIICLSHLGYEYPSDKVSDILLAKNSQHIDLIIGGHTHTFLLQPDKQKNLNNKEVIINQVGWAGINLGRLDYTFNPRDERGNLAFHQSMSISV